MLSKISLFLVLILIFSACDESATQTDPVVSITCETLDEMYAINSDSLNLNDLKT
jgi:hypothetical protein